MTGFQRRVYDWVRGIPEGCVTTYGAVARGLGCGSARAVGQALRRNPYAPDVPCHRVIAGDMRVGGFQGQGEGAAVRRKLGLLAREGVRFSGGRLADTSRLWPRGEHQANGDREGGMG